MMIGLIRVLESLAVIAAALVAIYGISSWRREMKGRKEYELAEEVLTLFYEAKDKISAIRNPLSWSGEGQSRKASPEEKPEEKEAFDRAHIVFERYQRYQETFNRLHALHYRFKTIFGRDKVKPFDDLNKIVRDIHTAATMLGHYWVRLSKTHLPMNEREYDRLIKNIQEYETVIWAGFDPDPIAPKVESLIEEIEKICEPILAGPNLGVNNIGN
ncbi:MAG: hypothetical protein HWN66_05525 [Candidatus Helarchaeota archaeon]|nr:hypothetical protein [Candidatus Helarchaeota archaeon]